MPIPREEFDPEDMLSEGPPTEESSDTEGPFGVPKDYKAKVRLQDLPGYYPHGFSYSRRQYGRGANPTDDRREIGPRYESGDEWEPAQLGGASVVELQRALINAGLLTEFSLGKWDWRSAGAYKRVLEYANASGLTAQMALTQMANSPNVQIGGSDASGRTIIGIDEDGNPIFSQYAAPPLELKTTNRDDLRTLIRNLSIKQFGKAWTTAQVDELVDAYNWKEIQVQKDAYDQQVALERTAFEQGDAAVAGQIVMQPSIASPEAFAETEFRRRDPTGAQVGDIVTDVLPMLEQALAGWG